MSSWKRLYAGQVLIASACAAIGAPYVFLTNTTAAPVFIIFHIALLWVLLPPCIATFEAWMPGERGILRDLISYVAGLLLSTGLMLVTVRVTTDLDWEVLLVAPLLEALVPLYSWYLLVCVYRAWQRQKVLAAQNEAEHARAAFDALNARIQPHFLFNTMASLEELIATDARKAEEYVRKLAKLFRGLIAEEAKPMVTLGGEIELVGHYLALQKLRFGDRLQFMLNVPADLVGVLVPKNLLINLVENAVKHGVETVPGASTVNVEVAQVASRIEIRVSNETSKTTAGDPSVGVRDIKKRLQLAYGKAAEFTFTVNDQIATALIAFPEANA